MHEIVRMRLRKLLLEGVRFVGEDKRMVDYLISVMTLREFINLKKLFLFRKIFPYTMVSYARINNTYKLAELAAQSGKEGAFVECGVWKGGCSAVMAYVSEKRKSKNRRIWLFDSFRGLPELSEEDGERGWECPDQRGGRLRPIGKCVARVEDVERILFEVLKLDRRNIIIRKGWFQETIPKSKFKIGDIELLRLDGDLYESTKCCLENLYDSVIPGGYIIIDDYAGWEGCKKATDEFLRMRNVNVDLEKIDTPGRYFQKPY